MKRNQVILIYGLPASGKYTVAKKIQEKCGGILLDNHYFYDLFTGMVEGTDERWSQYSQHIKIIRDIFLDVLQDFYPQRQPKRYIFTSVLLRGEKLPVRLQKFAHKINADFIPIELKVRSNVLVARCDTPMRRKRKKLHNKKNYSEMLKQWEPFAFHSHSPNKLIVDSTDLTADETFAKIKKYLKKFD